jgi:hypothetical protein
VLADTNGLARGADDALSVGSTLKVPRVVRNTNTATSFAVYEPAKIIGNTSPEAVMPPPPPAKGGCGGLGMIIVIVVAIVVTVITAGAAAPAMAAVFGSGSMVVGGVAISTAGAMAAGAIGAAVGSIVSQGVGIAIGVQDKFSWKQVGLSALGGAVGYGVQGALSGSSNALAKTVNGLNEYARASVTAAAGNAITQGVAVATGLQDKFNWRSVAASAIAAPAAQYIAGQLSGPLTKSLDLGAFGSKVADGMVRGVVGQGVRMLVTRQGKMDYASIAADAFGNAFGDSIVALSTRPQTQEAPPLPTAGERSGEWTRSTSDDEISAIADSIGQRVDESRRSIVLAAADQLIDRTTLTDAGPGGVPAEEGSSLATSLKEYWAAVKEGASDKMQAMLAALEERRPGLGKSIQVIGESMPELLAAAKQELKDAAPGLIRDAAITVGGMLLAEFTGGVSGAVAIARAAERGAKVAEFARGAYEAIGGAYNVIGDLPNLLSKAGTLVSEGVQGIVSKAAGVSGGSVEEIVSKLSSGPAAAKALPGIGTPDIDKALGEAMEFGDRLLRVATDKFTKNNALLSAVANAIYRHGDVAEYVSGFVLQHSGLFSTKSAGPGVPAMGPIQNNSGHGVDWVGRALTGKYAGDFVAFEVKGGLNGMARGLSPDQRNLQTYMQKQLSLAAKSTGLWASHNTEPGTAKFADYVRAEMRGTAWNGFLLQHNNMRTKPEVTWKPWR